MGSETEDGVLDILLGNKTDVDSCRISLVQKNTSDHCKKKQFGHIQRITCLGMTGCLSTTPTAAMETLLGLPPLHIVVEKEARQATYILHCSNHFKKSD
jgi:hypothetical protein